jgi:hypothetical protein
MQRVHEKMLSIDCKPRSGGIKRVEFVDDPLCKALSRAGADYLRIPPATTELLQIRA